MTGKIAIQDLAVVLTERYGLSKKEASTFVGEMFDIVQQELETDKIVKIKGFGTFKIVDVDDRESVNVNTGERVLIEGHGKITFTPDAYMKELVNKPFSQFETVVLNEGVDFKDDPEPETETPAPEPIEERTEPVVMPLVDFGPDTSVTEEEPIVDIPETEDTPKVEAPMSEEEPVSDEEPVAEEEPMVEEAYEEETELPEETHSGSKWWVVCLAGLVGLVAGYLLGNYFPFTTSQQPAQEVTVKKADVQPVAKPEPVAAEKAPVSEEKVPEAEETAPEAERQEPKPEVNAEDPYAAKDVRVRLGAYRIVGTDKVVKVKEGETLSKISRRIFGPDMECYIEVFNDLSPSSELKPGQEIKIPKLEHKKKKK